MAEIKIGVVDYARLFEESPQAKVVQDALHAEFGPRCQQLVAQENSLKPRGEKLQKDVRDHVARSAQQGRKGPA